ncbi:hypothetical protein ANT2_0600 [plant metagenome]|uniref:Uncharacterized protein n=1 Tax=plant metagenome TaxID=1297885 RepID=A0A484R3Y9_9ZZZZ
MVIFGYIAIALGVIFMITAIYAQSALSEMLDHFRNDPALLKETGAISDLYFLFDLLHWRHGFVKYLYRHREPPAAIAAAFPDYARLRKISNVVYALKIGLGVYLLAMFVAMSVIN